VKIGLGFGLLILIACLLGGVAVVNMVNVGRSSSTLADEYVPEVIIANEVERFSLSAMMEIRSYGLSADKGYLESGQQNLAKVREAFARAKALVEKYPDLSGLKQGVASAEQAVGEYESLIKETQSLNESMAELLEEMNQVAAVYMKNCSDFLASQNETMTAEIASGASADKLAERQAKIGWANGIIDLCNDNAHQGFESPGPGRCEDHRGSDGQFPQDGGALRPAAGGHPPGSRPEADRGGPRGGRHLQGGNAAAG